MYFLIFCYSCFFTIFQFILELASHFIKTKRNKKASPHKMFDPKKVTKNINVWLLLGFYLFINQLLFNCCTFLKVLILKEKEFIAMNQLLDDWFEDFTHRQCELSWRKRWYLLLWWSMVATSPCSAEQKQQKNQNKNLIKTECLKITADL